MGPFRYVVADVFTDVPLAGNPVAVFTDAREIPDERLQPLARELNLSESVFVYVPDGDGHVRVRIFTPTLELPFAGHPVLGTAFVLAGPLQLDEIRLETGSGIVPIRLERDGSRIAFGWMRQPVVTAEEYDRAEELLALLSEYRPDTYEGWKVETLTAALKPYGVKSVTASRRIGDKVAAPKGYTRDALTKAVTERN